jgi:hypothetical protein
VIELLHPGVGAVAYTGGRLVAVGLGHAWVERASGGWAPHSPALPCTLRWHDGQLQRSVPSLQQADEYVVGPTARGRRALAVLGADEGWWSHPSGALFVARDGLVVRMGAPGRTVRVSEVPLRLDSLRVSDEGDAVAGLGPEGPVRIELRSGAVRPLPGEPLHPDVWLDEAGRIVGPQGPVHALTLAEATPARSGDRVAGPGGRVHRLDHRGVVALGEAGAVRLGATVAWRGGFASLDWSTHTLHTAGCEPALRVALDWPDDDLVSSLEARGASLWAWSVEGRCVEISSDGVVTRRPATPEPDASGPSTVSTPLGPLEEAIGWRRGPRAYAVASSGWWLGWMVTPSTSGNS